MSFAQGTAAIDRPAQFRYGVVLALTSALVVFVIAAPSTDWSRALALALEGFALVVAVATARQVRAVRYRRALIVGIVILAVVVVVATGVASRELTAVVSALVAAAVPLVIVRGLARLVRERGVTIEAVAGALAIYLSIGLVFAWIISFVVFIDPTPYFAQQTDGTEGERVYFSFTVLTTTGFGDFSAASPAGHALAVIEMLTGQIYLVTVIGMLVGSIVSRRTT